MLNLGARPALMLLLVMASVQARGDEFERLGGELLGKLLHQPKPRVHSSLSFRELEALPSVPVSYTHLPELRKRMTLW